MSLRMLTLQLGSEHDVVLVRQRTRQLSRLLGFDQQDQTRIATAVSEIARNACNYGGSGKVEYQLEGTTSPQLLVIQVSDQGPGIANVDHILEGHYQSHTGLGLGIVGARRLMDQCRIETGSSGTIVSLKKLLPRKAVLVTPQKLAEIATQLALERSQDPLVEIQQQNQELLRTLDELRKRQDELSRLNDELEDTNRGVVALYAELDEKADHLRRADELKSRFLSNMSHEFRTPVNSITALSRVLLERMDGELTPEQEKQVRFISKAAEDLSTLVNDLLDLAKVEAGKIEIHPTEFRVQDLFGALRGMLRPLLVSEKVSLILQEPVGIPPMNTDEAKVSQILRNFISNALKFTEEGEVRVAATMAPSADAVVFSVSDTGIGISPELQEFIFQEFTQVPNPLQKRVRGTGLGLPLTKKLSGLLGGDVSVESELGRGSTFSARIPSVYATPVLTEQVLETASPLDPQRTPVLVVEDSVETVMLYDKFLKGSGFQVIPASTSHNARQVVQRNRPEAIILDIRLREGDSWNFLARMKQEESTRDIPIIVITNIEDHVKAIGLGADAYCIKPVERRWLLGKLSEFTRRAGVRKILLVDDEETTRYWLRGLLADLGCRILETSRGLDAIRLAREQQPQTIFLDLMMPVVDGKEVLELLKANPATKDIPVIILTAKALDADEQRSLAEKAVAVLSKSILARKEGIAVLREALQKAGWDVLTLTAPGSHD
jgi:signal transduction histidine kinase/CheY-like chemotaxis protein